MTAAEPYPTGREVVAEMSAVPRDELPELVRLLRLADDLPRHAISRRILRGYVAAGEAVLAGVHPGQVAARWDDLVAVLTGPPIELAAANMLAGIEDDLATTEPPQ